MIEIILYDFLKGLFYEDEIPVYLERPEQKPTGEYVIIEKTGGSKTNKIASNTFAFQSYGPTLYQASLLNEKVKSAVEAAEGLDEISSVTLNSDYNFTDTASKSYRYQAVFVITHYA